MAGKTKDMSQIKQLLLLKKQGVSNRGIARAIGMNKDTVNNYVRKALGDELDIDGLLGLDDFGMKVLDGQQLLDLMEIIEDRLGRKSTIIVSQLSVADWYDVLQGNTTAADFILDRLVHTAIRFELRVTA